MGINLTAHHSASFYQILPESVQPAVQRLRGADFYQTTGKVFAPDPPPPPPPPPPPSYTYLRT
ncbi:hypothetical protein K6U37_14005 [Vibrio parahaemolyticus]|uniref:hypothetical protein n=1 Tax=Vibrio parahaemolyticus TaxID=670 RepID=UPI001EEC1582|nr:hypothetical protein [Vibrio parahaemolyticus]MCG6490053.1 hypothetical protein [Vibrio parahaemolyticus]